MIGRAVPSAPSLQARPASPAPVLLRAAPPSALPVQVQAGAPPGAAARAALAAPGAQCPAAAACPAAARPAPAVRCFPLLGHELPVGDVLAVLEAREALVEIGQLERRGLRQAVHAQDAPALARPHQPPLGLAADRIDEDLAQVPARAREAGIAQQFLQRHGLGRLAARGRFGIGPQGGTELGADLQQLLFRVGALQQRADLQGGRADHADDEDEDDQAEVGKAGLARRLALIHATTPRRACPCGHCPAPRS